MVKNRIYDILDRHPEVLSQVPEASDLFGAAAMLGQTTLSGENNILLSSELRLLKYLKEEIMQSNVIVKKLAKKDARARLLQSIPGIGPFFSVLILYEIDDIIRFRDEKKLYALTDKPSRRQVPVTIDYLGFTVPNKFIVGYGIDWDEKFRYLPDICFVEVKN